MGSCIERDEARPRTFMAPGREMRGGRGFEDCANVAGYRGGLTCLTEEPASVLAMTGATLVVRVDVVHWM